MKLIVGLGNPGNKYEKTRHNVGFLALDKFASINKLSINQSFKNGMYCDYIFNGEKVILLKPQKYMNLSGEVIRDYVNYFKIRIEDILVIYDDLDIEVGNIKIKKQGSSGGHNGLGNIELNLASRNYKRIKIGISRDKYIPNADYVLGKFSSEHKELIDNSLNKVTSAISDFLVIDFEKLMSKYNKGE